MLFSKASSIIVSFSFICCICRLSHYCYSLIGAAYRFALKCKTERKVFKTFAFSEANKNRLKKYMARMRRIFKFININTAVHTHVVTFCIDKIGYKLDGLEAVDKETRKETLVRRAKLVPAIFKLMTLALNRCIKARIFCKCNLSRCLLVKSRCIATPRATKKLDI